MKIYASSPHSAARGQSLVEFAISLTFMLILLSGAVYFGIGLFYYIAMRDAAQEGALYGSMKPDDMPGIQDRVEQASGYTGLIYKIAHPTDPDELPMTTTVTFPDGAACEGNGIKVTLEHEYTLPWLPIGAFIEPFLGGLPCNDGKQCIRLRAEVTDTILTSSTSCP